MPVKSFNPTTPTLRYQVISDFKEINPKGKPPEKKLLRPLKRSGGRNNRGRVTARGIGGGHKKHYRVIDFKRDKDGSVGRVVSVEYDPNRSSRIALVEYADKERRYIIHPAGLKVGDQVESGSGVEPKLGSALPIAEIPVGTYIHNIELNPGRGGKMARSAGAYAILMARDGEYAHLKLPSGEVRLVSKAGRATIGQVGNIEHENLSWGKAGRSRWYGWRPQSRAVVKNPVDHPMGGGEGKTSGGRQPCSRSGQASKGLQTRRNFKVSDKYIISRRKNKRIGQVV